MNKELIEKIIELEDKLVKTNFTKKIKRELFNLMKNKINQYLDNPNCIYNKNFLNLFNYNNNIDLNEYYNLMYSNLNNKNTSNIGNYYLSPDDIIANS
jgi:hypothetical protein